MSTKAALRGDKVKGSQTLEIVENTYKPKYFEEKLH